MKPGGDRLGAGRGPGLPDHVGDRQLLGIPEGYSAAAVLLVGYADSSVEEADGVSRATERAPLDEQVTYVTAE